MEGDRIHMNIPYLQTGDRCIDKAFRIAVGDLVGNIHPLKKGLLSEERPVIYAGIHYIEPWTRDTAFNVWNGVSLIAPREAKDTILSTINMTGGLALVGAGEHNYWDAIICVIGFWEHYLQTGDLEFLRQCHRIACDTIAHYENAEFDPCDGLFRGPACCMDAISAYPDQLLYPIRERSDYFAVLGCTRIIPEREKPTKGYGLPFKALSTNCLYLRAYEIFPEMEAALGLEPSSEWLVKAVRLKQAINKRFWLEKEGRYAYLVSLPNGPETCEHQEALGHSFAILFNVADEYRKAEVLKKQHLVEAGIPSIWPTFPRYAKLGTGVYGRASGPVWPHHQSFWAQAALRNGRPDLFDREFRLMAAHAERDSHFAEVLHPDTSEIYGGVQEVNFTSKPRQTWCATGFISLALRGLLGMDFQPGGITFTPYLPEGMENFILSNLHYRGAVLRMKVSGQAANKCCADMSGGIDRRPWRTRSFKVNGQERKEFFLAASETGDIEIAIELEK